MRDDDDQFRACEAKKRGGERFSLTVVVSRIGEGVYVSVG